MEPPTGRGFIGAGLRVLRSLSPRGPLLPWSSTGPARSSSAAALPETAASTQLPEVRRPLAPRAPLPHSAPRRHRSHTPRRVSAPTQHGQAASPLAASAVSENADQLSQLPPQLPGLDAIEAGRHEISRVTPPLVSPLPLPSGPPPCGPPPTCPPAPPSRGRSGAAEECSQHTSTWQAQPTAHNQGAGVDLAASAGTPNEHAQKLLDAVFEFPVADQAATFMLDANPELSWLSQCVLRCPLPPCWSVIESRNSFEATRYVDMGTGTVTEVQPLLGEFIELARMMLFWRSNPDKAGSVAHALTAKCTEAFAEAVQLRKAFMGPYVDPKSGAEFWHCSETHRSTWGDPGAASDFLARVAEKLSQALPVVLAERSPSSVQDEETPWKAPPGKYHPSLPSGRNRHELSRGAYTARQRSPARGLSGGVFDHSEETLGDVGAALCNERSRRRRKCQSAPPADLPAEDQAQQWWASSMADPFDGSQPADLRLRPECRRRRPESRERLQPLDTEAQKPQQQIALCFKAFEAEMQNELRPVEAPSPRSRPPTRRPLAPLSLGQRAGSSCPDGTVKATREEDRLTPSAGQENLGAEEALQSFLTKIDAEDLQERPQALHELADPASLVPGRVDAGSVQPGGQVSPGELLTPLPSPTATPKLTAVSPLPSPKATPKLTAVSPLPSPTATPKMPAVSLADTDGAETCTPTLSGSPRSTPTALVDVVAGTALVDALGGEQVVVNELPSCPAAEDLAVHIVEQHVAVQREVGGEAEEAEEKSTVNVAVIAATEVDRAADTTAKQEEDEHVENEEAAHQVAAGEAASGISEVEAAAEEQGAPNNAVEKLMEKEEGDCQAEGPAQLAESSSTGESKEQPHMALSAALLEEDNVTPVETFSIAGLDGQVESAWPTEHTESMKGLAAVDGASAAIKLESPNTCVEFEAPSSSNADCQTTEPAMVAETSFQGEYMEQPMLNLPADDVLLEGNTVTPIREFSSGELNEQVESAWTTEQDVPAKRPAVPVVAPSKGKPVENDLELRVESSLPSAKPATSNEKKALLETGGSGEPSEQMEGAEPAASDLAAPETTMSVKAFLRQHSAAPTIEDTCLLKNSLSSIERATPLQVAHTDAVAPSVASTELKESVVLNSPSAPSTELGTRTEPIGPYWLAMPADSVQSVSSSKEVPKELDASQEMAVCQKISAQLCAPEELTTSPQTASEDKQPEEADFAAQEHANAPTEAEELQAHAELSAPTEATSSSSPVSSVEPQAHAELSAHAGATSSSSPVASVEPPASMETTEESLHAEEQAEEIDGQALLADGTLARQQKLAERRRAQQVDEGDLVEEFLKAEAKCIEAALQAQEELPVSPASSAEEAKTAKSLAPSPASGRAIKKDDQRAAATQPSRRRAASRHSSSSSQVPATPRHSSSHTPAAPPLRRPGQATAKASSARPRTPPRDQRASRPSARRPPPTRPASVSIAGNSGNASNGPAARSSSARSVGSSGTPRTLPGASRSSVQIGAAASLCQGGSARQPGRDGSSRRRRIAADGGA